MEQKSRVYVVQQPARFNHEAQRFVPMYDFSPAEKFGELVFLCEPGNIPKSKIVQTVRAMGATLSKYTANDYLIAVGDPVAIAATAAIASKAAGGKLRILKWDRITADYKLFEIEVC